MSEKLIRSLYEARLKAWSAARVPALPVAWENVGFSPPNDTYLQAFVLRAETTSKDLEGAMRNRTGVFQINIVCPIGKGAGHAESIAAEIDTLFPNNLRLTSGAFFVQSISPLRTRPAIIGVDRYTVPVDLQYRSDST